MVYQEQLPHLRGTTDRAPARCNKCGRDSFQTSLGVARVYWNGGNGGRVVLDDSESNTKLETSVKCVHCKTEHAPLIDFPAPALKNLQDLRGRGEPGPG